MKRLAEIQQKLKAPKNQFNKFGGYKYRSCEDILEALKPLLGNNAVVISDEIVQIGDRYYVKARACLYADSKIIAESTAYAREPLAKKGMDESQITGAASSYARKYALNGLLCIDDTKDADTTNDHGKSQASPSKPPQKPKSAPQSNKKKNEGDDKRQKFLASMKAMKEEIEKLDNEPTMFYIILGNHGFEKAEEIEDLEKGREVWKEMKSYLEEHA